MITSVCRCQQAVPCGAVLQVTVPGPHTARVVQVGRSNVMQLTPLGPAHPRASSAGLAKSFTRCAAGLVNVGSLFGLNLSYRAPLAHSMISHTLVCLHILTNCCVVPTGRLLAWLHSWC
jgi:hypothetical protein